MILLPQWLTDSELWAALHLAQHVTYTTVRGPYRMASLDMPQLSGIPPVLAFLDGAKPYGAYIIRYGAGAEKAPHVDPPPHANLAHDRLVCMLQTAEEGGTLMFDTGPHTAENWEPVPLVRRDAVQFRADLIEHAISPVLVGERIVLTVGRLMRKEP